VKEALQFSGPVSAAQRESQQDAWRELWVELQLGNESEQSYKARVMRQLPLGLGDGEKPDSRTV
jgi:hypothetical protein